MNTDIFTQSERFHHRALRTLPGGVSRNAALSYAQPTYAREGQGCWLTDVDGNRRLDMANNMTSLIHGHAYPPIIQAVSEQLTRGTAFNLSTEVELLYAEHLCERNESFEQIRFVNSGTEAVMCCLKAARAYTGKPKIAKVEGAYHGIYDYAEISQNSTPQNWGPEQQPASVPICRGTCPSVLHDVIVLPFNDPQQTLAILEEHASDLACILIDLLPHRVGMIPASPCFVQTLRDWTHRHDSLLIYDEVITFRSEYGGAQQWYDSRPDLTALGKIIGGGFPVGAIAGRRDIMQVLNPFQDAPPFPHSGTFSANPVTMTAGLAAMQHYDRDAVARLNALGERTRSQIAQTIQNVGIPACVTGAGSLFRIHFKSVPPENYRDTFAAANQTHMLRDMIDFLFCHGVMLMSTGSGALSTPMSECEIDLFIDTLHDALRFAKNAQSQDSMPPTRL